MFPLCKSVIRKIKAKYMPIINVDQVAQISGLPAIAFKVIQKRTKTVRVHAKIVQPIDFYARRSDTYCPNTV